MITVVKPYVATTNNNSPTSSKIGFDTVSLENMREDSTITLPYIIPKPITMAFMELLEEAGGLSDESVKVQTVSAIRELVHYVQLQEISSLRLPKPSLTENEDRSSLIEWNFANFRVGLSFEQDDSKSFCFFIQRDDSQGFFDSRTRRINGEIKSVISSVVNFVIHNI